MILAYGEVQDSDQINRILPTLPKAIIRTLQKKPLDINIIVEACDRLAFQIEHGEYTDLLTTFLSEEEITLVIQMLKRKSIYCKLEKELGLKKGVNKKDVLHQKEETINREIMPLGVLFHITAGNMDGLPAYSVIEGLLAGNINIVKLPSADMGISVRLLYELVQIEPRLAEYIYVFDTPSTDVKILQRLGRLANGIVVWGGDTVTEAVRRLATPNTKIIEWGHKISFAYITNRGMDDENLIRLAHHIMKTKQLLCSSCQGIYVDTEEYENLERFSEKFIRILEQVAKEYPKSNVGMQAQITLLLYNEELTAQDIHKKIYRGEGCSIIVSNEKKLTSSFTHGNLWVRPMKRQEIIKRLYPYKGYLQTAGLLCAREEREELSKLLLRAGTTRVTSVGAMSRMLCDEPHDGEYPLRRYTKVVEYDG